jgi:hypothetical protein
VGQIQVDPNVTQIGLDHEPKYPQNLEAFFLVFRDSFGRKAQSQEEELKDY